jgi:hypothetical protein
MPPQLKGMRLSYACAEILQHFSHDHCAVGRFTLGLGTAIAWACASTVFERIWITGGRCRSLPKWIACGLRRGRTRRAGMQIPVTINDRFHIGSDSKAFTSLLTWQFVEAGKPKWSSTPADVFPELTDPRNLHFAFRRDILGIIAALVVNAAPASEQHGTGIKFREGLALWLRVLGLLSRREAEWIEAASELWPSALRQCLNSALHQHGRRRSRSSPFRCTFFRPGLKYINHFEFRSLSAVNEAEQQTSGI